MTRSLPPLERWIVPGLAVGALVLGIAVLIRVVRNPETDDAIVMADVIDVVPSPRALCSS